MEDYTYNPDTNIKESTSLDELDELEILNRNTDENAKTVVMDNNYPNILEKPLYVKTVPDSGLLTAENTTNSRTQHLSEESNNIKLTNNKKISDMSIKKFGTMIANSLLDIINELLSFKIGQDNFIEIFTKEERLISIGILLVAISVFFIFFRNTE